LYHYWLLVFLRSATGCCHDDHAATPEATKRGLVGQRRQTVAALSRRAVQQAAQVSE
jgi:hypothetical protein